MQSRIDPLTSDYDGTRIDDLSNAVYLRLETPLGSYWPDPSLGSRLHTLRRMKDKERVSLLARQYAEEALAPLVNDGRAAAVSVTSERSNGRLVLRIRVEDASGQVHEFSHPVAVA